MTSSFPHRELRPALWSFSGLINRFRSAFPVLLLIIPLAAVNIGHRLLVRQTAEWEERARLERVRQALETLAGNATFPQQMARVSGQFRRRLQTLQAHLDERRVPSEWSLRQARRHFSTPFPAHQMWVASIDPGLQAEVGIPGLEQGADRILLGLAPERSRAGPLCWF
jgi:hypothetical protein